MPASRADRLPPTDDPRCGTRAGYRAHSKRGEFPCPLCRTAENEHTRQYRATPAGREAVREASRQRQRSPEARAALRAHTRQRRSTPEGRASANAYARASYAAGKGVARTYRLRRERSQAEADHDFMTKWPDGKPCKGCGEVLPMEAFTRNMSAVDGRQDRCNASGSACQSRYNMLRAWPRLARKWSARGIDPDRCIFCGHELTPRWRDIEHVMPRALGGADDFTNLAPACPTCNRGVAGKHDSHPITWLAARFPERLGAIVALFPHIALEASHV